MTVKEIFRTRYHLSEDTVEYLVGEMELVSFQKKEMILREGEKDHYIYFIESGIVRSFVRREDKTVTLWIVGEGGTPLSTPSLTHPDVSRTGIEALTECYAWRVARRRLGELCEESLVMANFARRLCEEFIAATVDFFADYYGRDRKEQYKLLLKQCPDLFRRLPLNEIASYLSVTPQSLSRIRAGMD